MIAQIGPLVQVGTVVRYPRLLHVAGGVLGGAGAGVALGAIGTVALTFAPAGRDIGLPFVGGLMVVLGLVDTKLLRITIPYPTRQTPGQWSCRLGPAGATFAWGLDLGTSVTTAVPYAAMIAIPVSAVLGGSLWVAAASVAVFGAARSLAVAVAIQSSEGHADMVCTRLAAASWPRWLVPATAISVGVLFLLVAIQ